MMVIEVVVASDRSTPLATVRRSPFFMSYNSHLNFAGTYNSRKTSSFVLNYEYVPMARTRLLTVKPKDGVAAVKFCAVLEKHSLEVTNLAIVDC